MVACANQRGRCYMGSARKDVVEPGQKLGAQADTASRRCWAPRRASYHLFPCDYSVAGLAQR